MMEKRGQGFSLQTVVTAVIILIVLGILIFFLTTQAKIFDKNINPECTNCKIKCGSDEIQVRGDCKQDANGNPQICCEKISDLPG